MLRCYFPPAGVREGQVFRVIFRDININIVNYIYILPLIIYTDRSSQIGTFFIFFFGG